ncbi:chemotaxis protein [Shewanella chilikensis]|uniref:chemotaxis protein n=1 Tax=Shewanella chilikensis TaxID=558541 RepID=UPI001F235D95|nr:chemotaxis protein [Shewanella chilikensis]MCE9789886.1 chemotaxis protein [Shewanella chilikensis]
MRSLSSWGLVLCLSLLTSGCSLLEVKLESGIEPLPQEQLSMRVFTREYASSFFAGVEQSADLILLRSDDLQSKSNALMWKINAEQTLGQTIFQVSPVAAMIDTWAFTAQMAQFFDSGNGKALFGEQTQLAANTSQQLLADYERRMQGLMSKADFTANQQFIREYAMAHPLFDVSFPRVSAFNDWLSFRKIGEFDAVTTFGSVPEVMSDMSDRMAMLASQTPKLLGWKAELFALHSNINSKEVQQTLKDISETSAKFQKLMNESPQLMSELAVDLRRELTPLLAQLDASAERNLAQLSVERLALEKMVERERIALEQMVDRERQAVTKEADALVQRTVTQVFEELTGVIKSLILYIVLFLLVVFFAPLGLGVWLGKRIGLKQASMTKQ